MKKLNYLMNGLAALAICFLFAQCGNNASQASSTTATPAAGLSGMKIAYVEIDTLL